MAADELLQLGACLVPPVAAYAVRGAGAPRGGAVVLSAAFLLLAVGAGLAATGAVALGAGALMAAVGAGAPALLARDRRGLAWAGAASAVVAALVVHAWDAPPAAGMLLLAGALALLLALPRRAPWETAVLLCFVPAAIGSGLAAARGVAGPWEVGAMGASAACAAVALPRALASTIVPRAAFLAAIGIAAVLSLAATPDALAFATLGLVAPGLCAVAFLRHRAAGASTRMLAGVSVAYAVSTFLPLRNATALGIVAGFAVVATLEVAFPELDPRRARARALVPRDAPAKSLGARSRIHGRYRVVRELGAGSFGVARLAEDEVLGIPVVLKTLKPERAGDPRFLSEARAMAALKDARVVEMMEIVESADHGIVLVLEYVDGGSLRERLARGPFPPAELDRLARDLLGALAAVHAAGLVHGDVKPANVLLTRDGRVKLADFGVARAAAPEATLATAALSPPVGTLAYMSPEQARGQAASAASDLYSAGATVYEAATGERYLRAVPNESAIELQMRLAGLRAFEAPAGMRRGLADWLGRLLAPEPAERPSSASEALAAYERFAAQGR